MSDVRHFEIRGRSVIEWSFTTEGKSPEAIERILNHAIRNDDLGSGAYDLNILEETDIEIEVIRPCSADLGPFLSLAPWQEYYQLDDDGRRKKDENDHP